MLDASFEDALAGIRAGFAALERSREAQVYEMGPDPAALLSWRRGRRVRSTPLRRVASLDERAELLALLERLRAPGRRSTRHAAGSAGESDDR